MNSCRILILQGAQGADYLADMIYIDLVCMQDVKVETNRIPSYLYASFQDLDKLFGRGFTLYGKMPAPSNVSQQSLNYISDQIKHCVYDFVVFSSVRRYATLYAIAKSYYSARNLFVVDGEDDRYIDARYLNGSTYYKRELSLVGSAAVKPISFFLPSLILSSIEQALHGPSRQQMPAPKDRLLAPCDPRIKKSYTFGKESDYYMSYARSLYGYTCKKGGWDCLRHYEIVASGCLPYFHGIEKKPRATMHNWPIDLQRRANHLYLSLSSVLRHAFTSEHSAEEYRDILDSFRRFLYGQARAGILFHLKSHAWADPPAFMWLFIYARILAVHSSNLIFRLQTKLGMLER